CSACVLSEQAGHTLWQRRGGRRRQRVRACTVCGAPFSGDCRRLRRSCQHHRAEMQSADITLPHIKACEERRARRYLCWVEGHHANELHHGCLQMHGRVRRWQPGVYGQCPSSCVHINAVR
ncbi:unnamed protein product, partial [Ectocarpus sp. 6 AP-2014]